MRRSMPILILILAAGTTALAQGDLFHVCVDPLGGPACGSSIDLEPFTALPLYVLISEPSGPQLMAWEGAVNIETTGSYFGAWEIPAGGLNVGAGENYAVGHGGVPLLPNLAGNFVVLSMELVIVDDSVPIEFYIRGYPGSLTFPDGPGFASDIGVAHPGMPCTGDLDVPVLVVNGVAPQPDAEFAVEITAATGELVDAGNFAGALAGATDGRDYHADAPEPPLPPSDYVSVFFDHPEWMPVVGTRFMTDYRAPYDPGVETKIWPVGVVTDRSDPVRLTFGLSEGFSPLWAVFLHDPVNGWTVDTAGLPGHFEFDPVPGEVRPFEVWIGPAGSVPPSPPHRTLEVGWSLVGLPLAPPDPGTMYEAILREGSDVLPTYVYDHDPATGYRLLEPDHPADQRKAYWAAVTRWFDWAIPAGTMTATDIVVPLDEGWTMVGYPLWAPTALDGVVVHHALYGDRTWNQAVDHGWISAAPFGYDNAAGDYFTAFGFQTWHGYWVACHSQHVELVFNFATIVGPGDKTSGIDLDDGWRLSIALDGREVGAIGASASARDGFDARYDLPAPPPSPAAVAPAALRFPHPEWSLATGPDVVSDIRASGGAPAWEAVLTAPEPGPVVLSWDPAALPAGVELELYLPGEDRVAVDDMGRVGQAILTVGEGPLSLVLRAPDGSTDAPAAPERHAISSFPNPFNPATEISLRTVAAGAVGVEIHDARGRRVRTFELGERPAGTHAVTWRGRDDAGRMVAGGTYFARLVLDGVRTDALAKLTLVK